MTKYWFKPKKYGYGAMPSSREGWSFTILFILFVLYRVNKQDHMVMLYLELIVSAIILIVISKKKTDGVWKWRWGKE